MRLNKRLYIESGVDLRVNLTSAPHDLPDNTYFILPFNRGLLTGQKQVQIRRPSGSPSILSMFVVSLMVFGLLAFSLVNAEFELNPFRLVDPSRRELITRFFFCVSLACVGMFGVAAKLALDDLRYVAELTKRYAEGKIIISSLRDRRKEESLWWTDSSRLFFNFTFKSPQTQQAIVTEVIGHRDWRKQPTPVDGQPLAVLYLSDDEYSLL